MMDPLNPALTPKPVTPPPPIDVNIPSSAVMKPASVSVSVSVEFPALLVFFGVDIGPKPGRLLGI